MVGYRLMMKRRSLDDSDPTGKALVVAEEAGLSKYTEYLFPNSKEERIQARNNRPGYADGLLAGKKIRLDDALESGCRREQMVLPGLK